jgi:hypothetical protein
VALTQGKEGDGALDDLAQPAIRFTPAFRIEDPQELGITVVALRGIEKGFDKAARRVLGGRSIQIKPEGGEYLGGVAFELVKLIV